MTRRGTPAEVRRDAYGVPHVVAGSVLDLARAQGRVTALDRAWQVEHARAKAEGRLAAWLGPGSLPWDRFARRIELTALARRAFRSLDGGSRAFVEAYVAGIGEGLADVGPVAELDALGAPPGRWEPWTPLAVFAAHHVLFATMPSKLWRHGAAGVLGEELLEALHHEGLWSAASNSWVVGGERTASGMPLIAGDPHRTFEMPNVYQQVRLTCTDPDDAFDVAGFTFPGVPGVQHFAHAGSVAWGITNAMADYQDVYLERLTSLGEEVRALGPHGPEPVRRHHETIEVRGGTATTIEVLVTARGPVFHGGPGEPEALSLRTASGVLGDLGFGCLLPLLRARTAADVDAALDGWVEPVNNVLVADRDGDVRQRVAGRVPERAEANRWRPVPAWEPGHDWTGWVEDLPRRAVPADGHLATANHRMTPAFDRIGVEFAPPGRGERITQLLGGRSGLTAADMAAVHADDRATSEGPLLEAVAGLTGLSGAGRRVQEQLAGWDRRFAADSAAAAAYVDVRDALVVRLAATPPFDRLDATAYGSLFAPWLEPSTNIWLALPNLLSARGRDLVPRLDEAVRSAVEDAARTGTGSPGTTWGARHRYRPLHALGHRLPREPELAGDNACVRCTGALPGSDVAVRGSVARYVWDLAGLERSGWVVPLGSSGDPASRHHRDQTERWRAARVVPLT